jgi:branched-chain amino acid transport system substrate-binding protein
MTVFRLRLAAAATACVVLAGCSSARTNASDGAGVQDPIRIAIINPQTGDYSPLGKWEHKGVKLAVDQANAARRLRRPG